MRTLRTHTMVSVAVLGCMYVLAHTVVTTGKLDAGDTTESPDSSVATLIKFTDDPMAKCLDGSPGSMYISHGSPGSTGWVIMHNGGGWCTGLSDCCVRSTGFLGSSTQFNETVPAGNYGFMLGYLSRNMFVNPVMHNYTFAILNYCDGSSGTSALEEPMEGVCESIENAPDKLYFRGKYIKEAAFEQLVKRGIMNAENVVIAGNSAGALAAQLHANFYKERLPNARVTGLSDSGIFLDYDTDTYSVQDNSPSNLFPDPTGQTHASQNNVAGRYTQQLQWVYMMMNSTSGVDPACAEHYGPLNLGWRCMFSQFNADFLTVPFFFLQSIFDQWQLTQIAVPNWNVTVVDLFGGLLRDVVENQVMNMGTLPPPNVPTRSRSLHLGPKNVTTPHHGLFLESCYHHCGFWGQIGIDGYTAPTAHMAWLANERAIYEQIAPFPCHDCCTIMHLPTPPAFPISPLHQQQKKKTQHNNPFLSHLQDQIFPPFQRR